MKKLAVNYISADVAKVGLTDSEGLFSALTPGKIDNLLWSDTGYKPDVSFLIAYTDNSILLKYTVAENSFKADYRNSNDPVYKDSCVEFFIAFNNEASYYNLEFNALGVCLAGFGSSNADRMLLDVGLISQIQSNSLIGHTGTTDWMTKWELTLNIPFSVFYLHQIDTRHGITCRANFFKCGDDLPQPHFLSWNPIEHPVPNFHLPQFFGELSFS